MHETSLCLSFGEIMKGAQHFHPSPLISSPLPLPQVTEGQHEELKLVREHVRSCFDDLFAFLMPHPGLVVATGDSEDGKLAGMYYTNSCHFS